jgi:hypothetical protein
MSLMLVNPRKRKAPRSAAQKAATRRMVAANRSGKRHASPAKRRSNPLRARADRAHVGVKRRARRRNPIGLGSTGGMVGMLMNGLKGAGGAVAVNAVTNYLPTTVTTGKLLYATRAALAIALGTVGKKVLGQSARTMAEGALAVNFHDLINSVAGAHLPGSALHGVGQYLPLNGNPNALPQANGGTYMDSELNGVGEYMNEY